MLNTEDMYEELDSMWLSRRSPAEKLLEKAALELAIKNGTDFDVLKNSIDIIVFDKNPKKLTLLSLISGSSKPVTKPAYVVQSLPEPEPEEEQPDAVTQAFQEIYDAWPENDIKQNEKYARIAFVEASRKRPVDELKKACSRYIEEMNDPQKASAHVLGIKRFVSDDDILDSWLQKASYVNVNFDASFFEVSYSIYPDFQNKKDLKVKEDSLSFYRRFVKAEEELDFYCAVQNYASARKDEIRDSQFSNSYETGNDVKFTKKFITFIRTWKQQPRESQMVDLIELPLANAFKKRNIQYQVIYPDIAFRGAIGWSCQVVDETGALKGLVFAITNTVENVCNYLTSGKNSDNIAVYTEIDYSIVSEVVAAIKLNIKTPKVKGILVQSE